MGDICIRKFFFVSKEFQGLPEGGKSQGVPGTPSDLPLTNSRVAKDSI